MMVSVWCRVWLQRQVAGLRIIMNEGRGDEDIGVAYLELYVR